MTCCLKKSAGFLLILVILTEAGLLWWIKTLAPSGLMKWIETTDSSPYYGPDAEDPPYKLGSDDRQFLTELVSESHALSNVEGDFARIAALRNWSREICPEIASSPETNDPSEILNAFLSGRGGACGAIAVVYVSALISQGYRARIVQLIRDENNVGYWTLGPPDTHLEVEVFSPDHQKWIVSDPTFNCWFHRPGSSEPLSARDIQLLAHDPGWDIGQTGWISMMDAGLIVPEYDGYDTLPKVDTYYIDPVLFFRNVFLIYDDIFNEPSGEPLQKYSTLLTARFLGSRKIIWLQPPGAGHSYIYYFNLATDWLPIVALVLLIVLFIPGVPGDTTDDEELDEEADDEDWE